MPDREIMSLFKRAVANDKHVASRIKDKAGRKARLKIDDDILEIVTNYKDGHFTNCNRPKCRVKLSLSEALRLLKGCEEHRGKSTASMQKHRSRVNDLITEKELQLWIMKVRRIIDALRPILIRLNGLQNGKDKGKKRARYSSDDSFVFSSVRTPRLFIRINIDPIPACVRS